jgi:hypothetical protein
LRNVTIPGAAFADVDVGDKLTYEARMANGAALPSWLHFDAASGTFSGTPGAEQVGQLSVMVTARDAAGAQANGGFDLAVRHVNHTPLAVKTIADQSALEGKPFSLVLPEGSFTDADAKDVLGYSSTLADGSALPAWLAFDPGSRTYSGTPPEAGKLAIRISANDGAGGTADISFSIDVAAPVFMGPPVPSLPGLDGTAGADTLNGTQNQDIIRGQDGNDTLYGYGGNDLLYGGAGADKLYGGDGNDLLDGGAGNDVLDGGRGNDTYLMYRGMGKDTIDDFDYTSGNTDTLQIGAGISVDQLWFRKTGIWDLEVGIIGTDDSMTIRSWDFWSKGSSWENAQHVEQFKTADGKVLVDTQVNQLIQAMAAFAPPPAGQTTLPPDYQAALAPVLAANWK